MYTLNNNITAAWNWRENNQLAINLVIYLFKK